MHMPCLVPAHGSTSQTEVCKFCARRLNYVLSKFNENCLGGVFFPGKRDKIAELYLHVVPITCYDSYVGFTVVICFCGKLSRLLKGCIQRGKQ